MNKLSNKNINLRIIGIYLFVVLISISIIGKILRVQHFKKEINTTSQPKYFTVKARGTVFFPTRYLVLSPTNWLNVFFLLDVGLNLYFLIFHETKGKR